MLDPFVLNLTHFSDFANISNKEKFFQKIDFPVDAGKVHVPSVTFDHNKFSIFKPSIRLASALFFMPTTPFGQMFLSVRVNYRNIVFK